MCDTLSILSSHTGSGGESFFAKNSDREPGEEQVLRFVSGSDSGGVKEEGVLDIPFGEVKEDYLSLNYRNLKDYWKGVRGKNGKLFRILLSQPVWLWGGEIGVNERGVAIGNEAVFPRLKPLKTAILGMDILRVALHLAGSAREAVDVICRIVSERGQAGNGGYRRRSVYHNSFIVQDSGEAYVVETAGREWIVKKVRDYCTISNTYLRDKECGEGGPIEVYGSENGTGGFKNRYESRLYNFFAEGEIRNRYKNAVISRLKGRVSLDSVKSIMRAHYDDIVGELSGKVRAKRRFFKRGMASVCIHSGRLIKSETTASLIVHYIGDRFVIWYTGSSFPCVSLYKPMVIFPECDEFDTFKAFSDPDYSVEVYKRRQKVSKLLERNYEIFIDRIKPLRDEYERRFCEIVYNNMEGKDNRSICRDISECHRLEGEYLDRVELIMD